MSRCSYSGGNLKQNVRGKNRREIGYLIDDHRSEDKVDFMAFWLSFVVYNCEFVTFPLVSWVRCGT